MIIKSNKGDQKAMIVQITNEKTTKIIEHQVNRNFSYVEFDPVHNRILFLDQDQHIQTIQVKKGQRYIVTST